MIGPTADPERTADLYAESLGVSELAVEVLDDLDQGGREMVGDEQQADLACVDLGLNLGPQLVLALEPAGRQEEVHLLQPIDLLECSEGLLATFTNALGGPVGAEGGCIVEHLCHNLTAAPEEMTCALAAAPLDSIVAAVERASGIDASVGRYAAEDARRFA